MDELKRLIELLESAQAELSKVRETIEAFQKAASEPDVSLDRLQRDAKVAVDRLQGSVGVIAESLAEASDIAKRLPEGDDAPAGIPATDLAKGFRSVIQALEEEAASTAVGDVATVIRSMDVELKGLIVADQDGTRVVPPAPQQSVDPGQLSTIRMSFAAVPIQRATVQSEDIRSGEAPPKPASRPTRTRRGGTQGRGGPR
jgi:hypothetical protein